MTPNHNKMMTVPNNYAGRFTLLQAMGLLAVIGLLIAWALSF